MSTKKVTFNNSRLVIIPTEGLDEVRPTTKAEWGGGGGAQDVEQPKKKKKSSSKLDCKTLWKYYTVPMILLVLSLATFATFLSIGEMTQYTQTARTE